MNFLDKELEQLFPPEGDAFTPKIIDKLARVYTHEGKAEWILVHVEVQDRFGNDFGKRMFEYFYRILDKYQRRITAWAILTESNTVIRPNVFELNYLGTNLHHQFNIYKIATQSEVDLLNSNNPFALVILAARTAFITNKSTGKDWDDQLFETKLLIARSLLKASFSKEKIRKIMDFLRYYTNFEKKVVENQFNIEIDQLTSNTSTMGIEELLIARAQHYGRLEGEESKSRIIVENAILKFGFTDEQAASIAEVSIDFVKKVRADLEAKK